jgi:DNA mismatch endonuclease, patch repair protein
MTDNLTVDQRRKNMQAIRAVSKLESKVSRELWNRGARFRRNVKELPGKPDIAIKKYRIVVFIDSCFWHMCEQHCNIPATHTDYWMMKLQRNQTRDREVSSYFTQNGWNWLRIWEHELKQDCDGAVQQIVDFINTAKFKQQRVPLSKRLMPPNQIILYSPSLCRRYLKRLDPVSATWL